MSKRWLKEHFDDKYVKQAQDEGYPSRAAYKLLAIHKKDKLFRSGMRVVDLGAAPGGWSMVAAEYVGAKGRVIAVDILPMEPSHGVTFIQGDFTEMHTLEKLLAALDEQLVDVVMSDMAPNLSGQKSIDQPRAMYLVELAWDCAQQILAQGGTFLVKVFQGADVDTFIKELRSRFRTVKIRKPEASRARSSEIYVLAQDYMG